MAPGSIDNHCFILDTNKIKQIMPLIVVLSNNDNK